MYMRYFALPSNTSTIGIHNIDISSCNNVNDKNHICYSLVDSLKKNKNKIDKYILQWEKVKKYTNTYEFIHTQIPYYKVAVSKYKPISRSYFKMVEILNNFKLTKKFGPSIETFHLAEGPGGFIEAIANARKNKSDIYTGITLVDNTSNIPNWNKCKDIMKKYPNIKLDYGSSGTGDILLPINLKYCFMKYKNRMDLITADGGFDFSSDFNNQEKLACNLIFAEICFAILMQKKGGSFIIKFFDIFNFASIDLLYLLSFFYNSVTITKPCTSRIANSEKYVVCEDFKYDDSEPFYYVFYNVFSIYDLRKVNVYRFLNMPIPTVFMNKIKEINYILGQFQIENINTTIELILNEKSDDKLENYRKKNVSKCIDWCIKNSVLYNSFNIA